MRRIVGLCAIAALSACGTSNGGVATTAEDPGELFPLGNEVPVTVTVISSDRQPGNTVRVSDEIATVSLNDLTFDTDGNVETFEIVLGLPDGNSVTLDEENTVDDSISGPVSIGPGQGVFIQADTDTDPGRTGDKVNILVGFDLDIADLPPDTNALEEPEPGLDDVLFALARVDLDEGENGPDDQGFNQYMVFGDQTDNLPTGWATYSGLSIASVYVDGSLLSSYFRGTSAVVADFENNDVDITLSGQYSGKGVIASYALTGEDIPVDGSQYEGDLGPISSFTCNGCSPDWADNNVDLAGDVIGQFFGPNAEATAGVFGAEQTDHEAVIDSSDVEIVGGYAAYTDTLGGL